MLLAPPIHPHDLQFYQGNLDVERGEKPERFFLYSDQTLIIFPFLSTIADQHTDAHKDALLSAEGFVKKMDEDG